MLCGKRSVKRNPGSVPVHLNVYDLTPINGYMSCFGLGAYHSGLQVHGVEYAYGGHELSTTGIFEGEPKQCDRFTFTFRKSIFIGWTYMSHDEVQIVMRELAYKYRGDAYDLIYRNCNHFCYDACIKLTGNPIPGWVNRLAKIGCLFSKCIIPPNLNSTKVAHHKIEEDDGFCVSEEEKVESRKSKAD